MLRKSFALTLAALACMAASPKPAQKPAARPAKPAAATPAHSGALDTRDPASLIAALSGLSAQAQVARREGDAVFVTVTSPTETFSAQFAGCDAQGRNCQALLFDRQGGQGGPTLGQLNAFNQTSVMCRIYQAKPGPGGGQTHIVYSAILFKTMTRDDGATHLLAWQGCLADAADFVRDPVAYLANAA